MATLSIHHLFPEYEASIRLSTSNVGYNGMISFGLNLIVCAVKIEFQMTILVHSDLD